MIGWGQPLIVQCITDLKSALAVTATLNKTHPLLRHIVVKDKVFFCIQREFGNHPIWAASNGHLNNIKFWCANHSMAEAKFGFNPNATENDNAFTWMEP